MSFTRSRRALAVAAFAVVAAPTAAHATPPIWETNQGSSIAGIANVDDSDAASPALGTFAFPFYGTTYTGADVLTVGSNGFILPGSHAGAATDNTPTGNEMATSPFPIIAPYWADLNNANIPPDQGDTFYNAIDDNTDGTVDRVVITWKSNSFGCASNAAYPACKNDVQVQLLRSGRIIYGYDGLDANKGGGQPTLVGVSKGGLAITDDPGSTDFSARGVPFSFGLIGYEKFVGDPLKVDVDQRNVVLDPVGTTGFTLDELGEDIAVSLSGPASVVAGGTATYTATVKNNGEATASGVSLTATVPSGATFASSSAGCTGTGVVTCALGDLASGASATATITVTATQPGTLTMTATGRPTQSGDPAPDNLASASTTVTAAPPAADTVPGSLPGAPKVTLTAASQKLSKVASGGIKVSASCAAACGIVATAGVDSSTARKLRSGRTLGSASGGVKKAGKVSISIPVGKAVGRRLRRQSSVKVKITFTVSTEAGEKTSSKTITLKK